LSISCFLDLKMVWGFKKSKGSNKKKRSKVSGNKEKTSGKTIDNASDGNTDKSERLRPNKNGALVSSPGTYTPMNPETMPKKRHQRTVSSSDKLSGSTSKENSTDVASKLPKKPPRLSERAISSGTNDTSSKRQKHTKTRQKNSANKSMMQIGSEKEGKKSKRKSVANKKPVKPSSRRSTERVSTRFKRDDSAKKKSNRRKKWPKKDDRTTEMTTTTVDNTEEQKPKSITPGKEKSVMNKTEDLKPTPENAVPMPTISKPTDQKVSKEVNVDDDCATELRTCSLLRSPVPNKRHISPLHKNKNMQIN